MRFYLVAVGDQRLLDAQDGRARTDCLQGHLSAHVQLALSDSGAAQNARGLRFQGVRVGLSRYKSENIVGSFDLKSFLDKKNLKMLIKKYLCSQKRGRFSGVLEKYGEKKNIRALATR